MQKIQRLFNIDVREVSLVDKPAINESFTEVKRKDGLGNKKGEKVMDEKQVKDIIQSAITPLVDGLKAVEEKLGAYEKSVEETGKRLDELVSKQEEGAKSAIDSVKEFKEQLETVVEDSIKRFERIESVLSGAKTQKIAGQDGDGDGKKTQVKWPSLAGAR